MMSSHLSHFLARILRHDAQKYDIDVSPEGYVNVEDILEISSVSHYTEEDVQTVVRNDSKGRFATRFKCGQLQIKATQGHTMSLAFSELTPINHYTEARVVLHGTKSSRWITIKSQNSESRFTGTTESDKGLSRMGRQHIHFTTRETGAKSGFPGNCDIVIKINMKKVLRDNIQFFKSENDVILSPGNANGIISQKYFERAYYLHSGEDLPLD